MAEGGVLGVEDFLEGGEDCGVVGRGGGDGVREACG